jgi:manganese transport protein
MTTSEPHPLSEPGHPSLPDAHRTVRVHGHKGRFRRFLSYAGPAFLVSVGYMDPGNWGTDIAGGARYGYALLWVILLSNLMAILLQTLCVRLGLATGRDLAQGCRDYYKRPAAVALWLLCELAIIACDLAEVIGSAVALNLLFGIPLLWGVLITGADVLLLLGLMRFGFRKIEAIIVTLVGTIGACFLLEIFLSRPDWGGVLRGAFVPTIPSQDAFLIAIGILGATVMPHNLYLHSSIVQTRDFAPTSVGKRSAIRFATIDSTVALTFALMINAAILILAAATFHVGGRTEVAEIQQAHHLLAPMLGMSAAGAVFALALLASGQNSTVTATLAGQIVMEGFLHLRLPAWLRRLITRLIAVVPVVVVAWLMGESGTGRLLILSQVVLSLQLPFAVIPLVMFTSSRRRMGEFANAPWLTALSVLVAAVIVGLNVKLLVDFLG